MNTSLGLKRPLKIGIDGRLWNETGIGRYIRNLTKYLAQIDMRNQYVVFLLKESYDAAELPGINFFKRPADVRWHSLEEQIIFPAILYKEQLDLVHFPYFSYPILYKKPFVITIHDLILYHYPTGKASTMPEPLYKIKLMGYKLLMQHAAKHAKKIIAVSQATKDEIIDHLHADPNKIVVTYEGIDTGVTSDQGMPRIIDRPYFLYVGNAYPHKNLDKLLRAFAEFNRYASHVNLVLVGKEDYFYSQLKRNLLLMGIDKSVSVLSQITDAQLVSLYKHAIALVIPSLMEGFGLPAVEAMANNCLVVASDIPALQEVCGDAAIYFDPNNFHSIAETLQKVYTEQSVFLSKKQIGSERIQQFSWENMARSTLTVYESSVGI